MLPPVHTVASWTMQGRVGGGFWTRIHRERGLTANIFFLQSEMNSYVIDGTKVQNPM
jgi:hypothetical protein